MNPHTRTRLLAGLLLALFTAPCAWARPAFYWVSAQGTHLSLDYLSQSDAELEDDPGAEIGGNRSRLSLQYAPGDNRWRIGLGHSYDALDIDPGAAPPPQTNGDLHTLHAVADFAAALATGELRVALAPAVSASSNAMKDPGELGSEALQLWGAALYSFRGTGNLEWVAGIATDTRFGDQRAYPALGLRWSSPDTELTAVYPDIHLSRKIGGRWSVVLSVSPDGNSWEAYARDFEDSDDFRRRGWGASAGLRFEFRNGVCVGLYGGYRWDQDWRFRREDGSRASLDSDDAAFVGGRLAWFPD